MYAYFIILLSQLIMKLGSRNSWLFYLVIQSFIESTNSSGLFIVVDIEKVTKASEMWPLS
jgi:hypothetical protein